MNQSMWKSEKIIQKCVQMFFLDTHFHWKSPSPFSSFTSSWEIEFRLQVTRASIIFGENSNKKAANLINLILRNAQLLIWIGVRRCQCDWNFVGLFNLTSLDDRNFEITRNDKRTRGKSNYFPHFDFRMNRKLLNFLCWMSKISSTSNYQKFHPRCPKYLQNHTNLQQKHFACRF